MSEKITPADAIRLLDAGRAVTVEFHQRLVYRRFLPPNNVQIQDTAFEAADLVRAQIIQRRLEILLQDTTDLEKDEL